MMDLVRMHYRRKKARKSLCYDATTSRSPMSLSALSYSQGEISFMITIKAKQRTIQNEL